MRDKKFIKSVLIRRKSFYAFLRRLNLRCILVRIIVVGVVEVEEEAEEEAITGI